MMRTLTLLTLAVTAVFLSLVGAAAPLPRATPESVGLRSADLERATALLRQFVADRKIAGAVAGVARRGRIAYLTPVGVQDLASNTPMSERSLFRIYSMTKSVTSVAVMMLHDEGRVGLHDPVEKYLPEFNSARVATGSGGATRPPSRAITVQDLLLHTSGLSHRTADVYRRAEVRVRTDTLPDFVRKIVSVPLMEDPGTAYRYSEGTTVLGRLVEVVSGRPFDAFLRERVLGPLGMDDTTFWVDTDARARLVTVYRRDEAGGLVPFEIEQVPFTVRPALLEGAVGLVSTVPDYLRFCQMLLNQGELDGVRLLNAKTVELMTANGLSADVLAARGGPMGWGLANVNVVMDPSGVGYPANAGEYGWDGSAGTIFWIDPRDELIVVLMTQSSPANPDRLRQQFKALVHQAVID